MSAQRTFLAELKRRNAPRAAVLYLGRAAAALHATDKAQRMGISSAKRQPWSMVRTASLYAQAKRPDLAVPLPSNALATPRIGWQYAPVQLWLDPVWNPIRHDPRFQAPLKRYASDKPAVLYAMPTSATSAHQTSVSPT